MSFEAKYPIAGSGVVFRETFHSSYDVARNGGAETDVAFENGVASFNGSSSYIYFQNLNFNGIYSIRFIVTLENDTVPRYLLDNRTGNNDGTGFILTLGNGTLTSSSGTIYVNGVQTTNVSTGVSLDIIVTGITLAKGTGGESFLVGSKYSGSANNWYKDMDLIEVYNGTLTAEEVSNLYNNRHYAGLVTDGLVGYWDFTRQTAYDWSGNGNNGVLTAGSGGFKKQGLLCDRDNTKVELPSGLIEEQDVTVFFIAKPNSLGEVFGRIFDNGGTILFQNGTSLTISGSTWTSQYVYPEPNYVFHAITITAGGVSNLWKNNIQQTPINQSVTRSVSTSNLIIANNESQTRAFDGIFKAFGLYERILSANEIAQDHQYFKTQEMLNG